MYLRVEDKQPTVKDKQKIMLSINDICSSFNLIKLLNTNIFSYLYEAFN